MLVAETISKVRRAHLVQGKPIKAISRELKLSRKVIRKILRSGATAFEYERTVQPLPKIGAVKDALDELLAANEARPARERLTLMRIFEAVGGQGYAGGYDAVRRYARGWRAARSTSVAAAYVPLSFAPGEAYQFDWSHEVVVLGGTTVKIKVAHVRLCHSRMMFVRAYPVWAMAAMAASVTAIFLNSLWGRPHLFVDAVLSVGRPAPSSGRPA